MFNINMEYRREIVFNALNDNNLQKDTTGKKCFSIESLIIPKKFFKDVEKISFLFPNAYGNEDVVLNIKSIDGNQTTFKCAMAINKYAFKEYADYFVYDGRKIDRFIKCGQTGMNRNEIEIFTHDANNVCSVIPTTESNIRMTLCFLSA